jgi:hypothetical protein
MNRLTAILLMCVCAALDGAAQSTSRLSLKLDLTAPLQRSYGGSVQMKSGQKTALELRGLYGSFPVEEENIFLGKLVTHYAERRADTLDNYFNKVNSSSGWVQFGEGKPLPPVPDFIAKSFWQTSFGFRFLFQKKRSPWSVFLQPGLSVCWHEYYEVDQQLTVDADTKQTLIEGQHPYQFRINLRTLYYTQTRTMYLRNSWILGLAYDVGVSRKFGKHFFLEGRLNTGANLSIPYEEPMPPVPVRRFWARPSLMAGWLF